MSAYIILRIYTSDPEKLKAYQAFGPTVVAQYGGKFIARGGTVLSLEGPEEKRRIVIIEFPSLEQAKKFYYSDEYTAAIKLREGLADFEMIAIEGVA